MSGCCEHGNELSGSIKGEEFPDQVSGLDSLKGLCPMRLVI